MSLFIQRSVVEQFNFNGKNVRSVYVKDVGQCLVSRDVYKAVGYDMENGKKAIQNLVPEKYKLRYGDVEFTLNQQEEISPLHRDTVLLKEAGLYCFLLRCKRIEAESFMTWVVETVLPREVRRLAVALEEKDSALALLNDDLDASQRQLVALEQDKLAIERLERRAVPYLADMSKDNGMVVIQKNNGDEYPYLAICGQQGYVAQKIQNKLADYPHAQTVVLAETPNAIVHYNWLRERGCIVANPDRVRHFKLGKDYTHQRLMELQEA